MCLHLLKISINSSIHAIDQSVYVKLLDEQKEKLAKYQTVNKILKSLKNKGAVKCI